MHNKVKKLKIRFLNKQGSALVWALCIASIISILVAAALAAAMWTHKKNSVASNESKSLYICRSALETAASDIEKKGDSSLLYTESEKQAEIDFEEKTVILDCIRESEEKIKITAGYEGQDLSIVIEKSGEGWKRAYYLS